MKEEALKLADELLRDNTQLSVESAYMIRRLVEELEFQKKANIDLLLKNTYSNRTIELLQQETPQTNPLSYEEIHDIWKSLWEGGNIGHIAYNYARAIEERHGIK